MLAINQFAENFSKKYSKQIAISKATSLWQEVIPPHLKKITIAKKIKNETLYVSLKENEWLFPLTENKYDLIQKINDKTKEYQLEVNIKEIYFYYDKNFPLEENDEALEKFLSQKKEDIKQVTKILRLEKDNNFNKNKKKNNNEYNSNSSQFKNQKFSLENKTNDDLIIKKIAQLKSYYQLYFDWQKKYRDEFGEQNQQKIVIEENPYFYLEDQINSFFLNHNDGIDYFDNLNKL